MRILSFDQSLSHTAAVTLVSVDTATLFPLRVVDQAVFHPTGTGIYRLNRLRNWIDARIRVGANLVCRERHHMMQHGAAKSLESLSGVLDMLAFDHGMLSGNGYAMVPATTWKKFCLGKGNLKKDTAYMMHVNKFLSTTPYLLDQQEVTDDNISDAICIGITSVAGYIMKNLSPSLLSDDQKKTLKASIETMFDYGKQA